MILTFTMKTHIFIILTISCSFHKDFHHRCQGMLVFSMVLSLTPKTCEGLWHKKSVPQTLANKDDVGPFCKTRETPPHHGLDGAARRQH